MQRPPPINDQPYFPGKKKKHLRPRNSHCLGLLQAMIRDRQLHFLLGSRQLSYIFLNNNEEITLVTLPTLALQGKANHLYYDYTSLSTVQMSKI